MHFEVTFLEYIHKIGNERWFHPKMWSYHMERCLSRNNDNQLLCHNIRTTTDLYPVEKDLQSPFILAFQNLFDNFLLLKNSNLGLFTKVAKDTHH